MHTCSHAVSGCMDFQIQGTIEKLPGHPNIKEGSFDRVIYAGGAANTEQLETHLELSKKLHNSHVAILSFHEDCGAGAVKEDLYKDKAADTARLPGFEPKLFYIELDGTWKKVQAR